MKKSVFSTRSNLTSPTRTR